MSDKAETVECVDCSGRGFRGVLGGLCPTCSGTGVRTTGAVVGRLTMPEPHDEAGYTGMWQRLRRRIEEITPCGLRAGGRPTLDREDVMAALALDSPVPWVDESEFERLTTDRDVLRLEVQRLKDLNFDSQDLYAAIEAERDELRAEVERLKRELCTAEKEITHMRESNGRADDYSAKLERVIEALRYELAAAVHCHAATIRSIVRLANAGLELPEVTDHD